MPLSSKLPNTGRHPHRCLDLPNVFKLEAGWSWAGGLCVLFNYAYGSNNPSCRCRTSRDLFLVTAMSRAFFLFGAHIFLDTRLVSFG